jgi:hypothetical protein
MVMDGFYDLIKSRFIGRSPKLPNSSKDIPSWRTILKNKGGPIFLPPRSGMVVDLPSGWFQLTIT